MSEFCKTRAKKSSPDMFNFYIVLAGHDKVTDAGRATTCRRKLKTPSLQAKDTQNEEISKTCLATGKLIEDFRQKNTSSLDQTTQRNTGRVNATFVDGSCNQEKINLRKTEKKYSDLKSWNLARLELRSQVLTCSIFM